MRITRNHEELLTFTIYVLWALRSMYFRKYHRRTYMAVYIVFQNKYLKVKKYNSMVDFIWVAEH